MPHRLFCASSSASPCIRTSSPDGDARLLPLSSSSSRAAAPPGDSFRSAAGEASFNSTTSYEIPSSASVRHSLLATFQSESPVSAACIASSSYSSSSSPLLYFASGPDVCLLDLASLNILSSFSTPSSVKALTFSNNSDRIFTAHRDRRVRIWSASPDRLRHRLLSCLPTTSDLIRRSPLPSNYVQIRRHRRVLWIRHADVVSSLAAVGDLLFSASWDKTVKIWHATAGFRCVGSVSAHDDAVNAVAADTASSTVYTASADRVIRAWAASRQGLKLVATLEGHCAAVNALSLSADGTVLYSGGGDRSVVAWERSGDGGRWIVAAVLRGHAKAVMCLATVDDLVLSGSTDRTVRIWQRSDGYRCVAVLQGHIHGVQSVTACRVASTASESDYRVCSGSGGGEVRVWALSVSSDCASDSPQATVGV